MESDSRSFYAAGENFLKNSLVHGPGLPLTLNPSRMVCIASYLLGIAACSGLLDNFRCEIVRLQGSGDKLGVCLREDFTRALFPAASA